MRNMRTMDESTVSVYVNFALLIGSTIAIVLKGDSFLACLKFGYVSSFLIILCGMLVIIV